MTIFESISKKFQNLNSSYLEYIPLLLIPLIAIAQHEIEHHALKVSCKLFITILVTIIFFSSLTVMNNRIIALVIASIFWILFIYIKNRFVIVSP
jgi:hypothetical protein